MSGDTHAAVAASTALACAATIASPLMIGSGEAVLAGTFVAVLGGLFPDLDQRNSKGSKILDKIVLVGIPGLFLELLISNKFVIGGLKCTPQIIAMMLLLGVSFLAKTRPHREATHSLLAMLVTTLLVYTAFINNFWVWWGIGYASHLFVDYFNTKGEAILFPQPGRYCLKLCSANGIVNKVLKYIGLISTAALYFYVGGKYGAL